MSKVATPHEPSLPFPPNPLETSSGSVPQLAPLPPPPPAATASPPEMCPPCPVVVQTMSSSPFDLPCPAAVLHSQPSSPNPSAPLVGFDTFSSSSSSSRTGEEPETRPSPSYPDRREEVKPTPRCHFRSQDMLQACHLEPGQARWSCLRDQGEGLVLVSSSELVRTAERDDNGDHARERE